MAAIAELTTDTFKEEVTKPGLTVIDFWAAWCGPCRAMAPQLERAAALRPDYRFAKVNVDEEPALAQAFQIMSIPTLVVIKDGEMLGASPGVLGADQLVSALDRLAAPEAEVAAG